YISKTKDSFNVVIIPKKDMTAAFNEAMGIVARACKTGFTDSEYARVKSEIIANYERLYNERDKTKTSSLAKELIRHFVDNEPAPGIAVEFDLVKQFLAMLPIEAINQLCAQAMLPSENQVVVYCQPTGAGEIIITEQVMGQMLKDVLNAKYEAYVDEVITDPLIAELPKPGSISKRVDNLEFGTTVLTLSNGVKVIVKTTDFAADQIIMTAWKEGGKRTYSTSQAPDVLMMDNVYDLSTWGPFDGVKLKKYLAGKQVSLGYSLGGYTNSITGSSTVKDLPTLMELIYTSFTNLSPDPKAYSAQMEQARVVLENQDKDPQKIFFDQVAKVRYGNNPLMDNVTVSTIDAANYDTMLDMVKKSLANAAEYTFVFTGNVELNELVPLLNQYIATLPVARRQKLNEVTSLAMVEGQVKKEFKQPMQAPSTYVYDLYSGKNLDYNVRNNQLLGLTGDVLDIIYTETLREEMGGTYGASVGGVMNPNTNEWQLIYFFQTNKDQQEDMMKRADAELEKLLKEGAKSEHFNKVKEAAIKQLELQERNNSYWVNGLMQAERGYNTLTGASESLKSITLDDLNKFMKGLYDGKNRIQVIMEGTPAE
ncbi:MAG: insulinase family protein, partial [Muribaculaceae bacterium]|nr:insulinase family protein [Muribaculaceae bacterium]